MLSRRAGLWLAAVFFPPMTIAALVIAVIEGDVWAMRFWLVPWILISVFAVTWLVRDLTGRSRPRR
ncbi:hypothetical protein [Cellulomonas phragmiteti]|uniref:Uncharacterized protein n=1 Tax=Cellulomonas phragmiteti TaxID=478780 RepID=A0ABQ4DQK3_9CELL|nr:hypothetical protein [Cellulomonas phragmiteti]GIG41196.1 hypothetical protein Cph01nite_29580 [Cellulomonas phragmiteti]